MMFDAKPRKYSSDRQRVSFAASYLTDLAEQWWSLVLIQVPELPVRESWDLFLTELNQRFGDPDIAQSSQRALRALQMKENHRVNRYLIEFSEHASYTGWNEEAHRAEFRRGLATRIKEQLVAIPRDRIATLDGLKSVALECDNRFWEREDEKKFEALLAPRETSKTKQSPAATKTAPAPPQQSQQTTSSASSQTGPSSQSGSSSNVERKDLSKILTSDGKLIEAEKERRKAKGLCPYCGERPPNHLANCLHKTRNPAPAAGRATFIIEGSSHITEVIAEEVDGSAGSPGQENPPATQ
jgi:hypothetical protein